MWTLSEQLPICKTLSEYKNGFTITYHVYDGMTIPFLCLFLGAGFTLNGIDYPAPPLPANHPSAAHPSNHPPGISPGGLKDSHTPNVKKRHKRAKSGNNRKTDQNDGDGQCCSCMIFSVYSIFLFFAFPIILYLIGNLYDNKNCIMPDSDG